MKPVFRFAWIALVRSPRAWLPLVALSLSLAFVAARSPLDPFLTGGLAGFFLPLTAWLLTGTVLASPGERLAPLCAMGGAPRSSALFLLGAAMVPAWALALFGAALALMTGARGSEVRLILWVSLLGSAAYVAVFSWASTLRKGGLVRSLCLASEFVLSETPLSGLTVRGHLESLFGGEAVWGLSQRMSSTWLVVFVVVFLAWCARRMGPHYAPT